MTLRKQSLTFIWDFIMSSFKDDSRTASDKTAAGKKTILSNRLHPLENDVMPFNVFIDCAQRLSKACGFDATTVMKKVPSNDPASVEAVTIKKFLEAEDRCLQINRFFTLGKTEGVTKDEALEVAKKLYPQVNQTTSDLFGETGSNPSPIYINELPLSQETKDVLNYAVEVLNKIFDRPFEKSDCLYFGPGSAQVVNTKSPQPCVKTMSNWGIPNERFDPFEFWEDETALYVLSKIIGAPVQPDIILQVPKNDKSNRTIGVGTVAGIAAQHVVGSYVRSCLNSYGIDLNSLSDIHRRLAYLGSRSDLDLATLDLSMASDTISLGLAAALLNSTHSNEHCRTLYYKLLLCRADSYSLNGEIRVYHKLGPMGNADIFETETALFLALVTAIGYVCLTEKCDCETLENYFDSLEDLARRFDIDYRILSKGSSFGDDMILFLPGCLLRDALIQSFVESTLEEVGLTLNPEKSFFTGDFRESCGADYRDGKLVRGFYHHHRTVTLRDFIRCVNYFVIRGDMSLFEIWELCPEFKSFYEDTRLERITWDIYDLGYYDRVESRDSIRLVPHFGLTHEIQIPENLICDWSGGSPGGRVITYVDKSVSTKAQMNFERRKLVAETLLADDQVQDILMFSYGLRVDEPDVIDEKRYARILRIVAHLFITAKGEVRDLLVKSCRDKMERAFLVNKGMKTFYKLEPVLDTKTFPPKLTYAVYDKINVAD